jgi:hypothetical protein
MAGIFTRKAIASILNDEQLTPEERTDHLFSLYGRAIDDGYVTKAAADAAKNEAIAEAKAQAIKDFKAPDAKESEEYKKLLAEYEGYKTKQAAKDSEDFAGVKSKFFDVVYDKLDRSEKAKPVKEQLAELAEKYEEYFKPVEQPVQPSRPQFSAQAQGELPKGNQTPSFMESWGYMPKK